MTNRHVPRGYEQPRRLYRYKLDAFMASEMSDDTRAVLGRALTVYSYTKPRELDNLWIFDAYRNGEFIHVRPRDLEVTQ